MRKTVFGLTFLASLCAALWSAAPLAATQRSARLEASTPAPYATEQEWILASVNGAIAGMAGGSAALPLPVIADHIWSPATYRAAAEAAFAPAESPSDLDARTPLLDPHPGTLIDESVRISTVLQENMRAASAHEAAALVVGAFALRESAGTFDDPRLALSRMAAHLAVAAALRRPSTDESMDGILARGVIAALAGRQRDAMTIVDAAETRAASDADRAWIRALRLRVTGDWRVPPPADAPLLVQLEHGRAVRRRLGLDAYMDYVDTLGDNGQLADWARMAFVDRLNVEAGHVFTNGQIEHELAYANEIWSRIHQSEASEEHVMAALNDRPATTPVDHSGRTPTVRVLDWGAWAAHQQRHLMHAMIARAHHLENIAAYESSNEFSRTVETTFGDLTLFPVVMRWMAETPSQYQVALDRSRPLVESAPELVTQRAWSILLEKPDFGGRAARFPIDTAWFQPAVPAGTAFELGARALLEGGVRSPSRPQAAEWARQMPFDHWTIWANEYISIDGTPTLASVRKAFGPLLDYDTHAIRKMIDFMRMPVAERIDFADSLCDLDAGECSRVAELLLLANRAPAAAVAYDRWADGARDRVGVSLGVAWLMRYHLAHGNAARAEAIARMADDTGSSRGMELLAEWHERSGRYGEAEARLQAIMTRYPQNTVQLGAFLMRRSIGTKDEALRAKAAELLRPSFPLGAEPLAVQALPVAVSDGVRFASFGERPAMLGFRPDDVIVGLDGWRVRDSAQYASAIKFSFDEQMTFTVFRTGRYEQVQARVPERWLGARLETFRR
jgi:hypothetical protein